MCNEVKTKKDKLILFNVTVEEAKVKDFTVLFLASFIIVSLAAVFSIVTQRS